MTDDIDDSSAQDAGPAELPRRRGYASRFGSARGVAPEGDPGRAALARISIVLVEPNGPRNIGSTCRAMKNFGLGRLVLVNPAVVDHPEAREMASGAGELLRAAVVVPTFDDALRTATLVVGTTARPRDRLPVRTPAKAAAEIVEHAAAGGEVVVVFGREANGLTHEELLRCQRAIGIETAPEYGSLNLSQAVLLIAYELFRASKSVAAKGQGGLGRFMSDSWRMILEDELWRAMVKMKAMHPANASAYRESLTRVLTAGPLQSRDARVLFALARHAQRLADPEDPGLRPPRPPQER